MIAARHCYVHNKTYHLALSENGDAGMSLKSLVNRQPIPIFCPENDD